MTDKPKRPRDANQLAHMITGIATGEVDDAQPERAEGQRKGGINGGKSRAKKLSTKQRIEIAKKAAAVRWGKDETKP